MAWAKYWRFRMVGVTCLTGDVPLFCRDFEPHVRIDKGATIGPGTKIGRYTYIGEYTKIGKAEIGPFCSIAGHCGIGLGNHPVDYVSTHSFCYLKFRGFVDTDHFNPYIKTDTILGADVWMGFSAQVMGGLQVGVGAVVAAGAVVTKDVPPYAIVAGVPAKVIGFRFEEDVRERILQSQWWTWDDATLKARIELFRDPKKFVESLPGWTGNP
jgi:acetyltransferase-like isoleucine patch superfamily enzyme